MSVIQKEIDHGMKRILREHNLRSAEVNSGLFGEGDDPKTNYAYLGLIHQMGVDIKITPKMRAFLHTIGIHVKNDTLFIKIPKRPFMSNAFDKFEKMIIDFIVEEYRKVMDGRQTLKQMMDRIGVKHEGQIKRSFTEFTYKQNHPATIEQKGSSTPLIDNGQLRNSVKYKVVYK